MHSLVCDTKWFFKMQGATIKISYLVSVRGRPLPKILPFVWICTTTWWWPCNSVETYCSKCSEEMIFIVLCFTDPVIDLKSCRQLFLPRHKLFSKRTVSQWNFHLSPCGKQLHYFSASLCKSRHTCLPHWKEVCNIHWRGSRVGVRACPKTVLTTNFMCSQKLELLLLPFTL